MRSNMDYSLYLVTDRDVLVNTDIYTDVEEAIKGGVTLVQIREKKVGTLEFYNIAVKIKSITDKYKVPLIINDRIDIARAVDAAGVHLGQSDMPADIARNILGNNKIIGVSTSTLKQAKKAEREGADYVGVGAMFPTTTKDDASAVSVACLKEIKEGISIPVVAIGGISEKNISLLKPANIDGIAVVSAILSKKSVKIAAEKLGDLFRA
ncbi:thiamine phosphate synthase [Clostridium tagluense]|uniref:thiamine phosphate synthase n=1 Tax=Clostridium tagluense TaxID=360422 RepID=UPI001CF54376|nr:thiamine phosphate synthase [Clostridium tagluense]MCB2310607.1 thiamine phosphate synthase [Clostridium tagluense]MCB2315662.1 thiamine phosphate synthase [Clostridium tagluense]MCB2320516.1 thiamine phosphate synthase [Clostridium tagluense]MCB2325201.1 thiamine phosphate synthase [Clostridium tagluense]MCB2330053.1 thiamine phosphate synthase [Clostridium tagluense]